MVVTNQAGRMKFGMTIDHKHTLRMYMKYCF